MAERGRPRAWLTESAARVMRVAASAAHPKEAGGVLIGVHVAGGRPWVTQAVVVVSDVATSNYYELPRDARPRAVDTARQDDHRLGYLGDWHSHPADVGPSAVDTKTMRRLGADAAGCPRPLLIVARRGDGGAYELDARQLNRRRLSRVQVVLAGDLPAPPTDPDRSS